MLSSPGLKQQPEDLEDGSVVDQRVVVSKLNRHILLKFFLMAVLCYIDRTNLAFAALQLNESLGFSERVYGLGSSIFFIGYSALQIPSNLILVKIGAPVWLSIIIVCWGLVATSFAALRSTAQFYILRLLLGITESGTFPGMWFHMSLFYTERELGLAYSWISAGTALSQVFGAPLAAGLLSLDGLLGLHGWQWLFVVEGFPTILLGIWISQSLAESPLRAGFLKQEEAEWLHRRQQQSKPSKEASLGSEAGVWSAVGNWRTWHLAVIAMLDALVKNSIIYWSPLIIASLVGHAHARPASGVKGGRSLLEEGSTANTLLTVTVRSVAAAPLGAKVAKLHEHAAIDFSGAIVALLTALPFGAAAIIMLLMAKHSATTGERKLHVMIPYVLGAAALAAMAWCIDEDPATAFAAMLGATVLWGPSGIISALPATFLSGPAAATGVALINSIAKFGAMLGPFMIGAMRQSTDSYRAPLAVLAGVAAMTSVLVYFFPMEQYAPEAGRRGPGRRTPSSGGSELLHGGKLTEPQKKKVGGNSVHQKTSF